MPAEFLQSDKFYKHVKMLFDQQFSRMENEPTQDQLQQASRQTNEEVIQRYREQLRRR